jgi:hypothetical protein
VREHLLIAHSPVAACASFKSFWLDFFGAILDLLCHEMLVMRSGATILGLAVFDLENRRSAG